MIYTDYKDNLLARVYDKIKLYSNTKYILQFHFLYSCDIAVELYLCVYEYQ